MSPLRALDQNLWVAEQPLRYFGLSIGTRMTIVRLAGGDLVVISPIQLSEALIEAIAALGPVRHIIAPNLYHYQFAAVCKAAYPEATLWATAGLRDKRPELPIDRAIAPSADSPWPGLEHKFFKGFKTLGPTGPDALDEWVFYHGESRTLILTDTAFCFDESFPWLTRLVTQMGGGYQSLSPSILERLATSERAPVKAAIEQVLCWDFDRVIVAHGRIVEGDGKEELRRGYGAFLGCRL